MNGKLLNLGLVVLVVMVTIFAQWNQAEASVTRVNFGSTSSVTLSMARDEARFHVMAYESKLHGNRPVAGDTDQAQPGEVSVTYTSDRLRDEAFGGQPQSQAAKPVMSTSDRLREESLGQVEAIAQSGVGRAERSEW